MPQDSLRSIVYRSFVTCDDPSGVVECKTIRKSKTNSQRMEGKVEDVKSQKNSVTASLHKEEREEISCNKSIDELDRPSSVQLKEVSRGAEKLSKVVDSLSKGSFNRHSEDIAKDLLRGALSLQESLLMLGKLQEASNYMENLNKMQKEKSGGGKTNRKRLQRSYSERFGDHNNVLEFQKPRLSADGSSRDCYEELREVIRESFARQNLLPKSLSEEKACSNRKLNLSPDIASASSSQSSLFNSHDFASSDSSSSNLQAEKQKGSNLIAKLMGLEEFPSKPVESTPHNELQKGKLLKSKRPIFEIDLPNARKPSFIAEKAKPEQRTLGEIIEIMQFKGLMKSKSFEGSKAKMCHSNVSDFSDDAPPIVLIKPLHISGHEKELPDRNKCACGRIASDTREMLKLWKIKEGVPPRKIDYQKGVLKSIDIQRTFRAEKNAVKRISQEKGTNDFGEDIAKSSCKESKIQDNLTSTRTKASVPVNCKPQKKEVIEKRVDKIQKVAPSIKKAAEKNQVTEPNSRRSIVSKPNNQGKINSTKVSTSRKSTVSKNKVAAQPKCTTSNPISRSRTTMMLHNSGNRKKNVKNDKLAEKQYAVVVENIGHNVDVEIGLKFENREDMMETRITPSAQLPCEELRDASGHCTKDDSSTPCESTVLIIKHNSDVDCEKPNDSGVNLNLVGNESWKTRTSIRDILLSSASFLNHAEELFDTSSGQPMVFEETSIHDYGMADSKLIMDYANEFLEGKCQQWSLTVHPLLQQPFMRSKFSIYFDLLVAEICSGIENLKTYSKLGDETILSDTLHAVLERDLWGKGVVTGTWDLGWKNGFTLHEVEQVVVDIEELLLNGIFEDLLLDFSL